MDPAADCCIFWFVCATAGVDRCLLVWTVVYLFLARRGQRLVRTRQLTRTSLSRLPAPAENLRNPLPPPPRPPSPPLSLSLSAPACARVRAASLAGTAPPAAPQELVAASLAEYIGIALRLGRDPARRAAVAGRIRAGLPGLIADATSVKAWGRMLEAVVARDHQAMGCDGT